MGGRASSEREIRRAWLFRRWPGADQPWELKFPVSMSFRVGTLDAAEPKAWNMPTAGREVLNLSSALLSSVPARDLPSVLDFEVPERVSSGRTGSISMESGMMGRLDAQSRQ